MKGYLKIKTYTGPLSGPGGSDGKKGFLYSFCNRGGGYGS